MAVLRPDHRAVLRAETAARVMLAGGAPVGDRHIFWNFVSSSAESIERAKDDWCNHRFDPVPGDDEYTPLPGPGA
jgi:redox-sensitive bicupin YhaK (pirin superfamily)